MLNNLYNIDRTKCAVKLRHDVKQLTKCASHVRNSYRGSVISDWLVYVDINIVRVLLYLHPVYIQMFFSSINCARL